MNNWEAGNTRGLDINEKSRRSLKDLIESYSF